MSKRRHDTRVDIHVGHEYKTVSTERLHASTADYICLISFLTMQLSVFITKELLLFSNTNPRPSTSWLVNYICQVHQIYFHKVFHVFSVNISVIR